MAELVYIVERFPGICDGLAGFVRGYINLALPAIAHSCAQLLFRLEEGGTALLAHFFFPECSRGIPLPLLPAQGIDQADGCDGASFVY
jgi:hypothetical protein